MKRNVCGDQQLGCCGCIAARQHKLSVPHICAAESPAAHSAEPCGATAQLCCASAPHGHRRRNSRRRQLPAVSPIATRRRCKRRSGNCILPPVRDTAAISPPRAFPGRRVGQENGGSSATLVALRPSRHFPADTRRLNAEGGLAAESARKTPSVWWLRILLALGANRIRPPHTSLCGHCWRKRRIAPTSRPHKLSATCGQSGRPLGDVSPQCGDTTSSGAKRRQEVVAKGRPYVRRVFFFPPPSILAADKVMRPILSGGGRKRQETDDMLPLSGNMVCFRA